MKLIIDIDKETYSGIKDLCILAKYIDNTIKAILDGIPLEELSENPCLTCGNNCCNRRDCKYHNLIILKENKQ